MSFASPLKLLGLRHNGGGVGRYSDLFLVAGVAAIIAMMIMPLPSLAIDALVAINISAGVVMLLVSIYIASIVDISVFPSLLLITTLFRLALSIATTRMILLEGHAGAIINTFGNMVAGGNLVVGLVVFLIITVVQFIVIAKGAERVAEVAARFSLDAMPGKQLSIDSDLRSGLIDKDEAKRRRRLLEMESKLNGNLDGAMKFVKGDAIAGIIIVVINLLGGLAVGMLQNGMDFGAAVQKYSILTIGDGMVMQIPALLAAMSAGLLVTRGGDSETDAHLGASMHRQLSAQPKVFLVAGGMCWLLALVPGFPTVVFLLLGAVAMTASVMIEPRWRKSAGRKVKALTGRAAAEADGPIASTQTRPTEGAAMTPLMLEIDGRALRATDPERLTATLETLLDEFEASLGVALPRVTVRYGPAEAADRWRLMAFEAPLGAGDPGPAQDALDTTLAGVRGLLRRNAGMFIGIQEASTLLNRAGESYPEVVKEVARALPLARIAEIMRRLAEEEVPLRNLRDILESLADAGQREKDPLALTEFARVALRRQISHRYAPDGVLKAAVLEPALEKHLRESIRVGGAGQQLALEPDMARQIIEAVQKTVRDTDADAVLAAIDLRRHIRKLVEPELFDTPALSFHELLPSLKLEIVGRVALPDLDAATPAAVPAPSAPPASTAAAA